MKINWKNLFQFINSLLLIKGIKMKIHFINDKQQNTTPLYTHPKVNGHIMVVGTTGSGKSTFLKYLQLNTQNMQKACEFFKKMTLDEVNKEKDNFLIHLELDKLKLFHEIWSEHVSIKKMDISVLTRLMSLEHYEKFCYLLERADFNATQKNIDTLILLASKEVNPFCLKYLFEKYQPNYTQENLRHLFFSSYMASEEFKPEYPQEFLSAYQAVIEYFLYECQVQFNKEHYVCLKDDELIFPQIEKRDAYMRLQQKNEHLSNNTVLKRKI